MSRPPFQTAEEAANFMSQLDPTPSNDFTPGVDPWENYTAPEAYGDPRCPMCRGRGRLSVEHPPGYRGPPSLRLCQCVLVKEILANLDRGMAGLSKARKVPKSPLLAYVDKDLRISAPPEWFEPHMRHVALRQSPRWDFRVVSDADLVQAWLATAASKGMEIFDVDARRDMETASLRYMTLTDIAKAASLLVIRLGVKSAANREMPNVLLEVVRMRAHEDLPTWIWEQPNNPLAIGHLCWSEFVEMEVGGWERIVKVEGDIDREAKAPRTQKPSASPAVPVGTTLRDMVLGPPKRIPEVQAAPIPDLEAEEEKEEEENDEENELMSQLVGNGAPKKTKPKSKFKKGSR